MELYCGYKPQLIGMETYKPMTTVDNSTSILSGEFCLFGMRFTAANIELRIGGR